MSTGVLWLAVSLVAAVPASAQEQESTSLVLGVERSVIPELPDHVSARLTDADGDPIGNALISFWVEVELLGSRRAFAGSATTDATGTARVPVTPRQQTYQVRATYEGNDTFQATEKLAALEFPVERVTPIQIIAPPSQVQTLRMAMPRAMGIVVAILWLFFAAATVYVAQSVRKPAVVSSIFPQDPSVRISPEYPSAKARKKERPHG
ncbi:MAG: carboxypeptidase-like regulatory domain-containing protein [Acidimicrobiia bacterium]|nr:carboxypeptidase-like regulatory domain-containing protein [Acidimicrobiia bacterium]